jgi:hypothetical protein
VVVLPYPGGAAEAVVEGAALSGLPYRGQEKEACEVEVLREMRGSREGGMPYAKDPATMERGRPNKQTKATQGHRCWSPSAPSS